MCGAMRIFSDASRDTEDSPALRVYESNVRGGSKPPPYGIRALLMNLIASCGEKSPNGLFSELEHFVLKFGIAHLTANGRFARPSGL
jgi:hypothetical protein